MISSVRGTVLAASGAQTIVEVGGIGLAIATTPAHALALRVGQEAFLHTALIVREDELALFGFASRDELELFELLRGVSGVGPRSALAVLAGLTPDEIARAVVNEDDAPFRKVSGIGPKTAKLITVSLAGKLVAPAVAPKASVAANVTADVVSALVGLGWNERVAAQAAEDAANTASDSERGQASAVLRLALAQLGPGVRS